MNGETDSLSSRARTVRTRETIPYSATIILPENTCTAKISAAIATYGCGKCIAMDTVDMAYVSDLSTLAGISFLLACSRPEFAIRPKKMRGQGEAMLHFEINSDDIDLSLGNNRHEMNRMLETLKRIADDSLAVIEKIIICGAASADGRYAFNRDLAHRRAESAKRWLAARSGLAERIETGAGPEGWRPVLEAMVADGTPDSTRIRILIGRYGDDDDAAERHIRRLTCWPEIRSKYLPSDRRVRYEYTYTVRSFTTDEELAFMYDLRPDAFNEEELLRVAELTHDPARKESVYARTLAMYPQSQEAANNLAILLLCDNRPDEALAAVENAGNPAPELLNTEAVALAYTGKYAEAAEAFRKAAGLPEARYNIGLIMLSRRRFAEAYGLMYGFCDTNTAIAAIGAGHYDEAGKIMASYSDTTPRAEYVRAMICAHAGDYGQMVSHLSNALADKRLADRIAYETVFAPYIANAESADLANEMKQP